MQPNFTNQRCWSKCAKKLVMFHHYSCQIFLQELQHLHWLMYFDPFLPNGFSIYDVKQFWTILTPSPHRHAFITMALGMSSQNRWGPSPFKMLTPFMDGPTWWQKALKFFTQKFPIKCKINLRSNAQNMRCICRLKHVFKTLFADGFLPSKTPLHFVL